MNAAPLSRPATRAAPSYQNIPADLRALRQWVAADTDKVPINPRTGQRASVTDPGTWATFEEARAAGHPHVGFVLTSNDPFCIIDLDDKPEKPASDTDRTTHERIRQAFETYTERSTSGRGYHVVLRGIVGAGRRRGNVEVYDRERFMIFTGDVVRNVPITDQQARIEALVAEMPALDGAELVEVEPICPDEEIDRRARAAANGQKYAELYAGRWRQFKEYPSPSEADFALMEFLTFHSISNEQCRRMFKASGLNRPKAIRAYLDRMLAKLRAQRDTSQVRADAEAWFSVEMDEGAEDDLPPIRGPEVTDAMYYGLVGDVMRAASKGTEVHPAAAGLAFITCASAALGRNAYVRIGDDVHHARIFGEHVARSGIGGKGMARALTKRVRDEVERMRDPFSDGPHACGNYHDGGLSSREGLAFLLRDPSEEKDKEGNCLDVGVSDKRLYVVEDEMANVYRQNARDGNTLSPAIRTVWDGSDIAPATKTNRTRATAPHIAIHASITPFELKQSLDKNNLTNGFANRFLYIWAERTGTVPFPPPTPDDVVSSLARRLLTAIRQARGPREITATPTARNRFAKVYREHRRGLGMTEQMRGLLERYPSYAWRLSLLFALLDCENEIDDKHMKAALAWLAYCRDSTRRIFSTAQQEVEAGKTSELAQRIIEEIGKAGGTANRRSLQQVLGKPSKQDLDAALGQLVDAHEIIEESIPREGGGRPLRRYSLRKVAPPPPVETVGHTL